MSFSPEETHRYQRHLSLAGFGPAAQARLRAATILVVGAGGLACPALLYLAAAGVGRLVILDPDVVDVSNLQRQVLYTTADLGQPKALAAAARLRALNPHVQVEPHVTRLDRINALAHVRAADLVLDATDNFAARYLINDACVLAARPFVYGAIQGYEGHVSVFNLHQGPTYRDLFPAPPAPEAAPSCAEAGVLGVLPGLIGTLQATEAIKVITQLGEPLRGRLLIWDALTQTTHHLTLARDPHAAPITELPPDPPPTTACPPANEEITAQTLLTLLASHAPPGSTSAVQLLDVREPHERALGAIQPSLHIPLGQLAEADLSALRSDQPLIVYCAAGTRSLRALSWLRTQPHLAHARSLRGGYLAWSQIPPAPEPRPT